MKKKVEITIEKRWIIIPIETKAREFESKLLFAAFAAEKGYGVILGRKRELLGALEKLPKGIFFDKSLQPSQVRNIIKRVEMGHKYVCLDVEGLIRDDNFFWKNRLGKETLKLCSGYYTWGQNQFDYIKSYYPEHSDIIKNTGAPVTDLWRSEFRTLYSKRTKDITNQYGKYILINSNFGSNHYKGPDVYKKLMLEDGEKVKADGDAQNHVEKKFIFKHQLFGFFLKMLQPLSEAFPEYTIIVRPHPSENHKTWEKEATNLKNVKVIFDGTVTPWILGAEAVIHNGCSTAIESYILGTPVVSYRPIKNENYDELLPNSLSTETTEIEDLIKTVKKYLENEKPKSDHKKNGILDSHISNLDGKYAAEIILDYFDDIPTESESLDLSAFSFDENSIKQLLISILERLLNYKVMSSILNPLSKKIKNLSYTIHKFPNTDISEVNIIISMLESNTEKLNDIQVNKVINNCFCIYKSQNNSID